MNTNRPASAVIASARKTAMVAGALYLITHITSIIAGIMYGPILNDPAYFIQTGPDTQVLVAGFLEVFLVLAIVGTGALVYPFLKRQNDGAALSYFALRVLEAGIIAVGILPLLVIVTLRRQLAASTGVDPAALIPLGYGLASFHNWTHTFATNFIYGTHTVLLAYLLYKSRLVPRFIPALMLVGGPAVFIAGTARMFGIIPEVSMWMLPAALSALAWEVSLALWMIFNGFNRPEAAHETAAPLTNERLSAV